MKVELSLAALDTLCEDLRLGPVPFPLEVRSHGDTAEIREGIKAAVYADLARRGLATGTRPEDGLVSKLRLLAEPSVTVDLVALLNMTDTVPLRAVAAVRGRHGLLAVQRTLTVSLRGTRAAMVVAALVGLLPKTPAGTEKSMTQPAAVLRAGRGALHAGGVVRASRVAAAAAVMERPVLRVGQLGVTRLDDSGRRHREPGIGWFDTDEGRYATTLTTGPDGEDWVTVWPADNARLAHRLSETIAG